MTTPPGDDTAGRRAPGRRVRAGELAHVALCCAEIVPVAYLVVLGSPWNVIDPGMLPPALVSVLAFLALLALLATTLATFVRPVQIVVARALLGLDLPDAIATPTTATRLLGAGWCIVCAAIGFIVSVVVALIAALAVRLVAAPAAGETLEASPFPSIVLVWAPSRVISVVAGVLLAAVCLAAIVAAGRALTAFAPVFLGPTDADRRVLERRRAADAARANLIARELHDSVGHALTAITVQASAARAALRAAGRGDADDGRDVAEAPLSAIESLARDALDELDTALGVLRSGAAWPSSPDARASDHAPSASLDLSREPVDRRTGAAGAAASAARLQTVLDTAARGLELDLATDGVELAALPPVVARETVRIVQESLTNAVRHGAGAASLRIERGPDHVRVLVRNRVGPRSPHARGGGHGLDGMRERAVMLGGSMHAGPVDDDWLVEATLPFAEGDADPARAPGPAPFGRPVRRGGAR